MAQKNVLGHRLSGDHPDFLGDHHDAGGQRIGRAVKGAFPALHGDRAPVRRMHAAEDLDQSRFTGPVFADHGMDLPGLQGNRHVIQRLGSVEALG